MAQHPIDDARRRYSQLTISNLKQTTATVDDTRFSQSLQIKRSKILKDRPYIHKTYYSSCNVRNFPSLLHIFPVSRTIPLRAAQEEGDPSQRRGEFPP